MRLPVCRSTATRLSANRLLPGPMAAEVVAGRIFDRQVGDAEILVDGDLRPHAGVAGVLPRLLEPRVVAEFAGLRNGVEDPQPLAGARVVAADVALGVLHAARAPCRARCDAPTMHDVLRDDRRAVPRHLALDRIDLLVVVLLQIDDAVDAEVLERHAVLRVEADELIADRHVEHALVALAVGPVADAAARQAARRAQRALAFVEPVHPQQLAGPARRAPRRCDARRRWRRARRRPSTAWSAG